VSRAKSVGRRRFISGVAGIGATLFATRASARCGSITRPCQKHAPCYLSGTRILTPNGLVAVEDLSIGDLVTTASGTARPITWVGSRTHRREEGETCPAEMMPIKISRDAIADGVPHTDLYVSPNHAMFVDGVLIPARNLVNGTTITACDSGRGLTIAYHHIELESHDVIIAEGAPAESYRNTGYRDQFDSQADRVAATVAVPACAPYFGAYRRRDQILSYARSAVSPLWDCRTELERVRDRLADRGLERGCTPSVDAQLVACLA